MAAPGLALSFVEFFLLLFTGGPGLPHWAPPLPEDPVLLQAVPASTIVMTQWFGIAPAQKGDPNRTVRILNNPEMDLFLSSVEKAFLSALEIETRGRVNVGSLSSLARIALSRPGVLFLSRLSLSFDLPRPILEGGIVLNLGDRAPVFRRLLPDFFSWLGIQNPPALPDGDGLVPLPLEGPPLVLGFSGPYCFLALGEGTAEAIRRGLAGKNPGLGTNPSFRKLRDRIEVERPAFRTYLDFPRFRDALGPILESRGKSTIQALGLGRLGPVLSEGGLEGKNSISRVILSSPSSPDGPAGAGLGGTPLTGKDLDLIPRDADLALAFRLDPARLYRGLLDLVASMQPGALSEYRRKGLPMAESFLGVKIEEELLPCLGDRWLVWNSPSMGGHLFGGLTMALSLKREKAFLPLLERSMAKIAGEVNRRRFRKNGTQRDGIYLESFEFKGVKIYYLEAVGEEMFVAPAWCVSGGNLLVGLYPQVLKALLSRPKGPSLADRPEIPPLEGALALGWADLPALGRIAWPALQVGAQALSSELRDQDIPLKMSAFPSAQAVLPWLSPQTILLRRLPGALLFESRGSLPPGDNLLPSIAAAAGVSYSLYSVKLIVNTFKDKVALRKVFQALVMYKVSRKAFPKHFSDLWKDPHQFLQAPPKDSAGRPLHYLGPEGKKGILVYTAPIRGIRLVLTSSGVVKELSEENFRKILEGE